MVDLSQTAANVMWNSGTPVITKTAGAAITAGQTVYLKASDNKIYLTDADDSTEIDCVGIAMNTCAASQPVTYAPDGANVDVGATTTAGTQYVCSAAVDGNIAPAADLTTADYVKNVFVGSGTSDVTIDISRTAIAKP